MTPAEWTEIGNHQWWMLALCGMVLSTYFSYQLRGAESQTRKFLSGLSWLMFGVFWRIFPWAVALKLAPMGVTYEPFIAAHSHWISVPSAAFGAWGLTVIMRSLLGFPWHYKPIVFLALWAFSMATHRFIPDAKVPLSAVNPGAPVVVKTDTFDTTGRPVVDTSGRWYRHDGMATRLEVETVKTIQADILRRVERLESSN